LINVIAFWAIACATAAFARPPTFDGTSSSDTTRDLCSPSRAFVRSTRRTDSSSWASAISPFSTAALIRPRPRRHRRVQHDVVAGPDRTRGGVARREALRDGIHAHRVRVDEAVELHLVAQQDP
jgi:hypothetical protein